MAVPKERDGRDGASLRRGYVKRAWRRSEIDLWEERDRAWGLIDLN